MRALDPEPPLHRLSELAAPLFLALVTLPVRAQLPAGDTIRVGSVQLRAVEVGVDDTVQNTFEVRRPNGEVQRSVTRSVRRWVLMERGGETLLQRVRIPIDPVSGPAANNRFEWYLDPRTLAMRRFEQRTAIDSASLAAVNGCYSGWVDLEKTPRRAISCERATDRFASNTEDLVIAHLPTLRAGFTGVLATYGAIGGPGSYDFRVMSADTVRVAGRPVATWRVERTVTTNNGVVTMTMWIDQKRPRILQIHRDFGNGRVSTDVVLNP